MNYVQYASIRHTSALTQSAIKPSAISIHERLKPVQAPAASYRADLRRQCNVQHYIATISSARMVSTRISSVSRSGHQEVGKHRSPQIPFQQK
jgi:hypothetical protein